MDPVDEYCQLTSGPRIESATSQMSDVPDQSATLTQAVIRLATLLGLTDTNLAKILGVGIVTVASYRLGSITMEPEDGAW